MADHPGIIAYPQQPGMGPLRDIGTKALGSLSSLERGNLNPPYNPNVKALGRRADQKQKKYWG